MLEKYLKLHLLALRSLGLFLIIGDWAYTQKDLRNMTLPEVNSIAQTSAILDSLHHCNRSGSRKPFKKE